MTEVATAQNLDTFREIVFGPVADWVRVGTPVLTYPTGNIGRGGREIWNTVPWRDGAGAGESVYFVPSLFAAPGGVSLGRVLRLQRREVDVLACTAIVLDDLGTKIPLERLAGLLAPSFRVETSAGNFQWTYLFSEAQTPEAAKRLYAALVARELTDRGTARIIQPFRVPGSINTKPGRDRFAARIEYTLDADGAVPLYTLDQIVEGLRLELGPEQVLHAPIAALGEGQTDPVFEWLRAHDLILSEANARGFHDLVCPWDREHTAGGAEFAGYKVGARGAFVCMHGHCAGRGLDALKSWIREQDPSANLGDVGDVATTLGERLRAVMTPETVAAVVSAAEARGREDARRNDATAELNADDRVVVLAEEGMEHIAVANALPELNRLRTAVFRHSGGLVYVSRAREVRMFDPEGAVTMVRTAGMERVTLPWLRTELAHRVDFQRTKNRRLRQIDPPAGVLASIMAADLGAVPSIAGIASTPTMRPDGSLLIAGGYDPVTGFYLDTDLTVEVPSAPTREDALAAIGVLCELLAGFPMDDLAESVALAHMMGAVLRPAFPSIPGLLIEAPVAGSGKSYLTKVIGFLAHGTIPAVSNWPAGEEFTKHLHALLVAGVPYIAFDNANGVDIGGDLLCTLLTEAQVKIRILGETEEVTAPTTGVVVTVNGNHPRIMEDATQRFMTCYLRPDEANPREREFTSDPLDMLRRDRGRYVAACLTVARAYIAAGRPGAVGYGSFEAWSRLVRSSLIWLGYGDVLETTRAAMSDDPDLARIRGVLEAIQRFVGVGVDFTVASFLAAIQAADAMQMQALAVLIGSSGLASEASFRISLGKFLRAKAHDRVVDVTSGVSVHSVRLVRMGVTDGTTRWCLTAMRNINP